METEAFRIEVVDRLARIETAISDHIEKPLCEGCKLIQDMTTQKAELKWTRRVFYVMLVVATGANNADWVITKLGG